jgi:hypothetical protein
MLIRDMVTKALNQARINSVEVSDVNEGRVLSKAEASIQRRLEALDRANVTDERLAKVLDDGLSAMKVVEKLVDGCIERTEEPDMVVREKYLDKGMKARGWESINLKVDGGVDVNYRVTLSAEDRAHLLLVASRLRDMNRVLEMGGSDGTVQDGEIVSTGGDVK